ncbi:MAG: spermine synthase [Candidatus Thermofonsia Clade 1 bacterium]|jgi:predicted membrane-bound spermidine synthase|uniref:Spermine synthase n=1 Tax=Candidatus Thermofonsia Clade 1 bacterium TaxID=2364210 RepID=A0A2M8PF03_9CHLR|nr:MAG: spermine synthase [Candidatus Thermofonsia Clade 1 bacterium]RMF51793.1 MAG: spermine synthase [Chloroflexota bacterium]
MQSLSAHGKRWLLLAVFTSGMTTLAIELTASRLLGNVFGTSNLVWANVIGLMLLYLTVGYFVGGWLADRAPRAEQLYQIMAWAAFFSGLVPLVARPVLSAAASAVSAFEAGVALGSFVAVLVLFAAPITLLGCVSPFAVRIAVQSVGEAGKVSGRLYAISTLGSLVGTFLPTLWTIPALGTTATFFLFAMLLLFVALIGLALLGANGRAAALRLAWMPLLLALLSASGQSSALRPPPQGSRLLWEYDSAYNYIQVLELEAPVGQIVDGQFVTLWEAGTRELRLNEGQGIHSVWHPSRRDFGGTWDMFLAAPYFNPQPQIERICVIGLAAGTISTQYTDVFGAHVQIDGIEIDPAIVEAGRRFFGMTQPNLRVIVEDGRLGLRRLAQEGARYDLIAVDAYRVPYVPWHLTTLEFFQEARAALSERGLVAINVGRTVRANGEQDRRLIEAITHTMQQVFPSVHTLDVPESFNTLLIGTAQPTSITTLAAHYANLSPDAPQPLRRALSAAISGARPSIASEVLFTDDRAPVETIINQMVIDYLLGSSRP